MGAPLIYANINFIVTHFVLNSFTKYVNYYFKQNKTPYCRVQNLGCLGQIMIFNFKLNIAYSSYFVECLMWAVLIRL